MHFQPFFLALGLLLWATAPVHAQRKRQRAAQPPALADDSLFSSVQWRLVGPFRGGRSSTVTGVPGKPNLYYFGASGGGVWRTQDGGQTWENISDGHFGGSIGSVAVSESDPNVIYVGGGEKTVRGNVSYGYGMWKTEDAGQTWQSIGLKQSRHVPRVRVHPRNPDVVWAAVLGDLFKPTEERGVYKSTDGGQTWRRVLFANADAGAVDLILDPNNPRVLYATTWRVRRTPYSLESGGVGSDLWKSTDGGETWEKLSGNPGLPGGTWGIAGVTVSPVNSQRVWAIVENEAGGVFRSDDGGETWAKLNESRALRQRAWYYTRIYADPQDEQIVYVMNVSYHKSTDGGRTFTAHNAPHGDHHDLWIAPEDNQRMIIGDDGGAQVSFDGGTNWSTYHNQPTAQFYRVTTDDAFPYRIYGAQQDNSTVRIRHRSSGSSIGERDWEPTAGGESAHLAIDPTDADVVYGGSYGGFLTRVDHGTREVQAINVWPDNPMGYGAEGMKYRFQWNFPVFFSPHDSTKLYVASNHLHATHNGGQSWETISPDLTRADPTTLGPSGGPITKDNTGVEYYATIFAAVESPYEAGLLWAGSDDGLLHVSRDGGQTWDDVTPEGAPEWLMFNSIEPDPFTKGGAYVAATRYKRGDYAPYLYRTKDYGRTWQRIDQGIDRGHFTRVLRADPARPELLYAGTETGVYVSFDDGANWQPFQQNLPVVPITDLAVKDHNLIAATQGRSFWMIDDLTPLHQRDAAHREAAHGSYLFRPADAYRTDGAKGKESKTAGTNHPGGVTVHYYLAEAPTDSTPVSLSFYDPDGALIRTYATDAAKKDTLEAQRGGNAFTWDLHYPDGTDFDGMVLWWAGVQGPRALPGTYTVALKQGDREQRQTFDLLPNPRASATAEDLRAQFDFMREVQDKVSEAHQVIVDLRDVRQQLAGFKQRLDPTEDAALVAQADTLAARLTAVEEALYQTNNRSNQDPLNYPIRLTNKLAHLNSLTGIGNFRPTAQAYAFKAEVSAAIDEQIAQFRRLVSEELPAYNRMIRERAVDVIRLGVNAGE